MEHDGTAKLDCNKLALNSGSTHAAPSSALWFSSSYHLLRKHKFRFQIDYKILQWHLLCLCQKIALTSMFLSVFPWPKKRQHVRAIHCAWLSKYLRLSADWTVRKNSCNTTVFVKHGRDLQDRDIWWWIMQPPFLHVPITVVFLRKPKWLISTIGYMPSMPMLHAQSFRLFS